MCARSDRLNSELEAAKAAELQKQLAAASGISVSRFSRLLLFRPDKLIFFGDSTMFRMFSIKELEKSSEQCPAPLCPIQHSEMECSHFYGLLRLLQINKSEGSFKGIQVV